MKAFFFLALLYTFLIGLAVIAALSEPRTELCPYRFSDAQIRTICKDDLVCWSRAEYLSDEYPFTTASATLQDGNE